MNRRRFIQLGLTTTAGLIGTGCLAQSVTVPNQTRPKRGLGISVKDGDHWRDKLETCGANWFYTWGPKAPEAIPGGIQFVPMIFGRKMEALPPHIGEQLRQQGSRELLGFNEPDQKHQSNVTVEKALELWPGMMDLGLRLGSPACTHPDRDWMKQFMQGVESRNLRVDFITVHSYGGLDVKALMDQLAAVHEEFKRPLWITEFGVGDWKARTRAENRYHPEQIMAFMEKLLPQLDHCEYVERYAWFPAEPDNIHLGPCALFNNDGSLTPVGKTYRSV